MKLHELSIKRPVSVMMCVLIVLLLGLISLTRIPMDLLPPIEIPVAIVMTSYSGVGPEEIENIVTKSIENAVASVEGVENISSTSSEGSSVVIVEFDYGTDMDFATLNIREKVDMVRKFLPSDVDSPMVIKLDPSMMPIASLSVSNGMDEATLKEFVEDTVQPRFESISGVASVRISGGKTREIQVEIDPEKMSGYQVGINSIISALQMENLNSPGGNVEFGDKKLLVRSTGEFKSIDQIKNIPIMLSQGTIYLRDIANVKEGFKTIDSYTRMDGKNSIGISIQKQSDGNTVEIVNSIIDEIEELKQEFPDVTIEIAYEQGGFIEKAITSVVQSAGLGFIMAIIVLFAFLKNGRSTSIIATSIPLSIIATFVIMYFSGVKLNMISLGGLTLGIGMLVDSSVVVLENIYRFRSEGYSRIEAARLGTGEVAGAVFASIMTTAVVFLAIIFTEGMAGQIFRELALTVVFSLMASLIVALTLVPMLSSKYLRVDKAHEGTRKGLKKITDKWDDWLNAVDRTYGKILGWVLKHRKSTILLGITALIVAIFLLPFVGVDFMPGMDQGQFTVDIELPQGTVLEQTNDIALRVEEILFKIDEVDKVFVSVSGGNAIQEGSSNIASIDVSLKGLKERKRSTSVVVDELRTDLSKIIGAKIKVTESDSMMGGGGMSSAPISVQISGNDLDVLEDISKEVMTIVKSVEGTRQVESSIAEAKPEAQIIVDRDKAAYYGLNTAQVSSFVKMAVSGSVATQYKVDGDEIDVRVQLPESDRDTFEQLKNTKILSPIGTEVSLSDIAEISIEQGPISIERDSMKRYVSVTADIFGRDLGSVNNDISAQLDKLTLPTGYTAKITGEQEQMIESFVSLALALVLGIVLVYMVMAMQFESLLQPFIIMFSVPLAYSGSLFGLVITGTPLSVNSFLGVIMLAGIVVNNAIVLVDYINTLREKGMARSEAILKAGPIRLRPILMTSLTTMLCLMPMALGMGEGSESMSPMAIVVIGGLITSTFLTLVVVPVIYTIFDDIAVKVKSKRKKQKITADAVM